MAATVQGDMISDVFLLLTDQLREQYEKQAREIMLNTLDPRNTDSSQVTFIASMLAAGRNVSAIYRTISINYMELYNAAEGVNIPRRELDTLSVPLDESSFTKRMIGAGIYGYKHKLSEARLSMRTMPANPMNNDLFIQSVNNVSADFGNHVLRPGRDTIVRQTKELPQYKGWGRNTSPGACDFCMMLATRDNYRSKQSSSFSAHRKCSCSPEPITDGWSPSPDNLKAYGRFLDNEERLDEQIGKEKRDQGFKDRRKAREELKAQREAVKDKPEGNAPGVTKKAAMSSMLSR